MKLAPVINSLLDTDLYKFTMPQVFLHQFPGAEGEYRFKCRNRPAVPLSSFKNEIEAQIDHLCTLRLRPEELDYLGSLRFIKSDLVDYLDLFQFRRRFIHVEASKNDPGMIDIVARGRLMHVMLFEIFLLAIVSEVYFNGFDNAENFEEGRRRLREKIRLLKEFGKAPSLRQPYIFFDFGTRWRACRGWHEEVVTTLAGEAPEFFKGTSNVDLARRYGLVPMGTMAHEYLQAHQAFGYRLRDFQKMALENWVKEYGGDLDIALTDTVGMDAFLADFDLYFAKLFDGLRHDSGDPLGEWVRLVTVKRTDWSKTMNPKPLSIALAQLNYRICDFDRNVGRIREAVRKARDADLVVFSELALSGYYPLDLVEQPEFLERQAKALNAVTEISKSTEATWFSAR